VTELVQLAADAIIVKETISFPHGKADIEPSSLDLLDRVAEILKTTSAITRLTIEGHTDTTGDPDFNLPLSEARALAVKRYLESRGVDPPRLESRGFGALQPVDTNDTEAGRARNRRVEFKVTR
jgi:outer membrane protein OmpA-like peptidoglycan-associated protein